MEFFIGAVLAIGVGVSAGISGLDKDQAIYPTVTIVIATYYVLYAVMAQSLTAGFVLLLRNLSALTGS